MRFGTIANNTILHCVRGVSCVVVMGIAGTFSQLFAGVGNASTSHAMSDAVYLQESGMWVTSSVPLTAVGINHQAVFAGSNRGLWRLDDSQLVEVPEVRAPVRRLVTVQGNLWAITAEGIYTGATRSWTKLTNLAAADAVEFRGAAVVAAGNQLWELRDNSWTAMSEAECPFVIRRVLVHHETLHVLGDGQLTTFADGEFAAPDIWNGKPEKAWDWGELPSALIRDVLSVDNRLYLATDRGMGLIRGMSLTHIRGEDGLCYENTTCLARGFTQDVWIGTTRGAIRMTDGKFHYFAGARWLPHDDVSAIAAGESAVYIATAGGLGMIRYEPFTLLKKAAYYERYLEEWGQRRLGFVHKLEWDDTLKEYVREMSDNDGGYTEDYLAAESYRYAVTRDPEARRLATNTFHAMRWLEGITGMPGFPARAVWAQGERGHKSMFGSGSYPAEWHAAADGRFEWKGDTSSDEISAHFYGVPIFLDLAAQGAEIELGKTLLGRMAGHIQDHGWRLLDVDAKPTRWGRWDPEYFTQTPEGMSGRGLNGLEVLAFIKTAEVLTGHPKFAEGYRALVQLGYPQYTLRQSVTFPPEAIAHFDDQLALFVYGDLVRHERDPDLRSTYLRSLERSWEIVRIERNPWFNFVYGMLTGHECEIEAAVEHLREWPLDLRVHSYRNSHRADYRTPSGYTARKGGVRAFSPRETQPMRWDHWTLEPDGGNDGRDVEQPAAWLLAYWLGRYAGLIEAPKATEASVLEADTHRIQPLGAKPYDGPPRPIGY
jgi:hypothetical protein